MNLNQHVHHIEDLMAFSRVKRLANTWRIDRQFRQIGWWPGTYLWNFYQGRLRDHLPGKPAKLKLFRCKHGVTGAMKEVFLRIEPSGSDFVILEGVWVNNDYLHPSLENVKSVLDVGGNIGLSAVWFSEWLKPQRYAAMEPDPRNLPVLKKNIEHNQLDIKVFPCAATAEPGEFEFSLTHEFGCSFLGDLVINDTQHQKQNLVKVPGRTITSVLDELNWPTVDLVKMDIEGGERELMRNCSQWIHRVKQLVMEIHANTSPEEIGSFLPLGWKVERIGKNQEPTYRIFQ